MPLSWNEIKDRALHFSREWADESSEDAEAKSFWDAFFNVFGVNRRRVASFEKPVRGSDGRGGFIDLLWKGVLLVEHKSRGKDLDSAHKQALDYFSGLKQRDLPRFVVVSDFARFHLHDLERDETHDFLLADLHKNVRLFGFIAGYESRSFGQEDPVNIKAAERLGALHDRLKDTGYTGHQLEVFLVRLLFCLFAEDTGIFEPGLFREYLEKRTAEDGADLGMHLGQMFQVLNTPSDRRQTTLDEQLDSFPYVNGRLFEEPLPNASFDSKMRDALLECCALDWSRISPAIFGSLFQSIMDRDARRNLGAHYTTESNILKALRPLFLDDLRAEFEKVKRDLTRLADFQKKLAGIRVLDPACGCGNFLAIAYRELRLLELDVLRVLHKSGQRVLNVDKLVFVDVDQFHGIEIEEFPSQIAQVALWLTDHQMNQKVSDEFGQYFARLPLRKSPHIVCGNALTLDWREVVPPAELSYIVGNPPFVGAKFLDEEQRKEVAAVFPGIRGAGLLDYVSCWYRKAVEFMADNPAIHTAFVSTNSITQGEQVGALWPDLLRRGVKIHFAHRTFRWSSEASGKAAVHCVIIGFGLKAADEKRIFDYEDIGGEPHMMPVANINPYLVDAPDVVLESRNKPVGDVPEIGIGNKPIDGGNYLFTPEEKAEFLKVEPGAKRWFRKWTGADEFINGYERWCLWLGDCPPEELKKMPEAMKRVDAVKSFRLHSKSEPTRKLAQFPTRFHVENMPAKRYLVVPEVSSERRSFIPMGFLPPSVLSSNLVKIIPGATPYHFGVLTSTMHMAWVRSVCGRLKSDYRYSAGIVYNNFPWPEPTERQKEAIEAAAQGVLDAREQYPDATLAELYDPLTMPAPLVRAHQTLDRAVDAAYGKRSFTGEAERVAFLFGLYQRLTSLFPGEVKKPARRRAYPRTIDTRAYSQAADKGKK